MATHPILIFLDLKAVTIFVRDNLLMVYDSAGPYGQKLAELRLETQGSKTDKLAYYPNMPADASTYFFNLGALMPGLNRNNPCTLFESETDYVRLSPQRVVGADGIGIRRHTHSGFHSVSRDTSYHTVPIRTTGRHRLSVWCSNLDSESLNL